LLTWIVSIGVVMVYGSLLARVRRAVLLPAIYGSIAVLLAVIGLTLRSDPENVTVGAVFYVMISVMNLFFVSVFWSFLLEIFRSDQTKRLFGVIAVGGTAGALIGPVLTDLLVTSIGNPGVLFMGSALFVVAILCQRSLLHIGRRMRRCRRWAADRRSSVGQRQSVRRHDASVDVALPAGHCSVHDPVVHG
jgi:AAA family ATP:ADP antiporter